MTALRVTFGRALVAALACAWVAEAENLRLMSPDGAVQAAVGTDAAGQLIYGVLYRGQDVVTQSPIGITLAGCDLGKVSSVRALRVVEAKDRYPLRGGHSEASLDALRALYYVTPRSGPAYGLQVVVANEGFAWRLVVPGKGVRRVNGETAVWRLPAESRVWFGERNSAWKLKSYAGEWISAPLRDLPRVSQQGPVQGMPLVAELPGDLGGYALVTEAALYGYSGLRLRAEPDGVLAGCFTESDGFDVDGLVKTPWRVLMLASTLDGLVNNDLVTHLAPPPDPELFSDTEWVRTGRSVWSWWQGREDFMTVDSEKRVIDCAAQLGFEFTTLDEGWEAWTNAWDTLKEVCAYGRERKVQAFVWKHSKDLNVPDDDFAVMRTFLDNVQAAGAAGVKVDFMNSESAQTIGFDERLLREAAKRRLLVNFHGCQKPSGESRTYPNEVTREGVRGLELNRITENYLKQKGVAQDKRTHVPGGENQNLPASHDAALPFTRCVVGPADYTPVAFSRPGDTTWAHQLAMAYLVTSPLLVMAEHPQRILDDPGLAPALPFLRELPVTWDETRVLDGSRIGELAAFARRKEEVWYVAMVNGTSGLKLASLSPLFTGWDRVSVTWLADVAGQPQAFDAGTRVVHGDEPVVVSLQPGGGYVAKLTVAPGERAAEPVMSLAWPFRR